MKHGFRAICLLLMAFIAVSTAFGDDPVVTSLESRILETFDQGGDDKKLGWQEDWEDDFATEQTLVWKVQGSKFATQKDKEDKGPYPQSQYIATWPSALFPKPEEGSTLKSLGIHGKFDRRGYNWIDVYPVKAADGDDAKAFEIPIPGQVRYMDLWVWGSNLRYKMEVYLRDHQGKIYTVPVGSLNYEGWKNLQVAIPAKIPQGQRTSPRVQPLRFVKFRIWTEPTERVDDFYIYLDHVKVLTELFEAPYDGKDLTSPNKIQELWGSGSEETGE